MHKKSETAVREGSIILSRGAELGFSGRYDDDGDGLLDILVNGLGQAEELTLEFGLRSAFLWTIYTP